MAIETLTELGATDAFVALIPPGRQDPEIRLTPGLAFPDPAVVRAVARASDAPYEAEIDGRTFVIRSANATNETVLIAVATPDRPLIDRWSGVLMLPILTTAAVARERRRAEEMHRLNATTSRVAASLRLDEVLTAIVGDAVELLGASSGDVLLLDEDREVLRVAAVANLLPEMVGFEMRNDEGVSARAMATKRTMIVDDYERYRHRVRRLDRYRFRAVLCAPLMVRNTPIGALNVHATDAARRFDASDASLLSAFASHAAIAIDNARRFGNETRLSSDLTRVNHELERSLTLQRRLAEQVLMGAGPVGVAEELARLLDRTVVLQDAVLRIVAGASPLGEDWEILALVRDGGVVDAAIDDAIASGRPTTVAADDARLIAPVRIGPEVIGFLVLAETDPLSELDRALVDVAVTGVALEFAHLRAEVEVERRLRGDVVTDLVTGSFASAASVAARAAPLGLDLQVAHDVFVIRALRDADPTNVALRRQLLDLTHASVASWSPARVVAEVADSVVVLASRRDPRRGGFGTRDAVEIATDLSSVLTQ
ncbi:MAG TPA: GAF domain-containing protein, partial [Actinomycetota bacterium]|nr:GAF domain-containing protein [Actinomycetota bacterium]